MRMLLQMLRACTSATGVGEAAVQEGGSSGGNVYLAQTMIYIAGWHTVGGLSNMKTTILAIKRWSCASVLLSLISSMTYVPTAQAEEEVAFPEKFMLRLSMYYVDRAETDIRVASNDGLSLGTGVSFSQDLGGDRTAETPRIDMYYRFNERHRIEFSNFSIDREGRRIIDITIDIEDETYDIGETVISEIQYDVTRIGYAYSFYHSSDVELSLSAGLNFTRYEFDIRNADGSESTHADTSAPLPMFGLQLSYAFDDNWSIHYLSETFFIEVDDAIRGALLNYELNLQYRFLDHFIIGAGFARLSTDLEADDDDWRGSVSDSHRGYLAFLSYYIK